ncbi:MAG: hypothetical protein H0X41_03305 [Chitinophagaceae bacterium]|nr:hypothetical protein [Chitinophagaceae bacterium]
MSDAQSNHFSGLGVWVALFLAGCSLCVFITKLPSRQESEKNAMQSWITAQSSSSPEPIVVALGTSLTGSGLDSTEVLQKMIAEKSGRPVRVLKIWRLDAGPATYDSLLPALVQLRPSVVVIEANMLFYSFSKKKGWPAYVQRFRDFVNNKKEQYSPDSKPLVLKRHLSEMETFRSGLIDTGQLVAFTKLLAGWQKEGARLVLFNFPLEASLEIKKWSSADTVSFFRNLHFIERHCRIEFIDAKMRLDETNFIDHAHMNEHGQLKQSLLFCNLVTRQLAYP